MNTRPIKAAVAIAVSALAGTLLSAAPAQAVGDTSRYEGRSASGIGLNLRQVPSDSGKKVGFLPDGDVVGLICKVRGTNVGGYNSNNLWYKVDTGDQPAWVTAKYVENLTKAPPFCGDGDIDRGRVTASSLSVRRAPTLSDERLATLHRGDDVRIICKVSGGSKVDGNKLWYWMTDGFWVSARYVANVGPAPITC